MNSPEDTLHSSTCLDPKLKAIFDRLDASFDHLSNKLDEVDRRAELRHQEVMVALRQLLDMYSPENLEVLVTPKDHIQ